MGTQQILMIVLSVIVVGAAVAVGIQMFDTQANNQARNAVVSDLMQMGVQAQAWHRQPELMKVGSGLTSLIDFLQSGGTNPLVTPNATYTFSAFTEGEGVTIIGVSSQNPDIRMRAQILFRGGTLAQNYGINIDVAP